MTNVLRIAYAIQNVGGIDFSQDIGDTVPVKYTLRGLRKSGHNVSCLILRGQSVIGIDDINQLGMVWSAPLGLSGTKPFILAERGVRRLQRELKTPYYALFDLFRFYEACSRVLPNYTLCHEHNGLFCGGAALACRKLNIPYFLTFSADPLLERSYLGKPLRGLHRYVASLEARFTYRTANRIICVSEPAKQHLTTTWRVDPGKVVVIPNGVDLNLFKPEDRSPQLCREFGIGDGPIIGFVGGFQPWHGLDILLESFSQLLIDFPKAKLLLVGDGRARPIIDKKIADLNIHSEVIITGFIPQEQISRMLAVIDIAVLPYPKLPEELWFSPLKLYEYMAAGKAIVASRSGQIAEVIRDCYNGVLVEPGDVNDLAGAMRMLMREPEKRDWMGKNARQQAIEKHSWEKYIEKLEQVYLSAL